MVINKRDRTCAIRTPGAGDLSPQRTRFGHSSKELTKHCRPLDLPP